MEQTPLTARITDLRPDIGGIRQVQKLQDANLKHMVNLITILIEREARGR